MEADYELYQLHWEFFKSVNPKADELFFVELKINELDKLIKKGIREIDFANDRTDTIESYQNDMNRQTFFFHKEYKEFLDAKLKELKNKAQQTKKPKPELKIDQIALKYAYVGLQITRENGNDIAKEYGHNSGEKLFQRFTYYSSSANRKGKPNLCTPKKLDNKIKLIESIIELLPTDKQERAKDEVLILKRIYEAEYQ